MTENLIINIQNTQIDLNASYLKPNKYASKMKEESVKLFKNLIGKDWNESMDISSSVAYCFPLCENEKILIILAQIFNHLWILDDNLEMSKLDCDYWIRVYRKEIEPNPGSMFDDIHINIISKLSSILSESQMERYLQMMADYFESYYTTLKLRAGEIIYTKDEYFSFRIKDGITYILLLFLETTLGIELKPEILNHSLMIKFHWLFSKLIIQVNDLFSYKREIGEYFPINYVAIRSLNDGISIQESANLLVRETNESEKQILDIKQKIIDSRLAVSEKYLSGVLHMVYGNLNWSKCCQRYNSFEA
jgi:hypothetical protein